MACFWKVTTCAVHNNPWLRRLCSRDWHETCSTSSRHMASFEIRWNKTALRGQRGLQREPKHCWRPAMGNKVSQISEFINRHRRPCPGKHNCLYAREEHLFISFSHARARFLVSDWSLKNLHCSFHCQKFFLCKLSAADARHPSCKDDLQELVEANFRKPV